MSEPTESEPTAANVENSLELSKKIYDLVNTYLEADPTTPGKGLEILAALALTVGAVIAGCKTAAERMRQRGAFDEAVSAQVAALNGEDDSFGAQAESSLVLSRRLRPLLAGAETGQQSAALADLLSVWLVGHPPQMRDELLARHVELVRELAPINEAEIFAGQGHPAGRSEGGHA
jgi:hypothetical protein